MKKKLKVIASILLSVFVVLFFGINIISLVSRQGNYGVPQIGKTSFLIVYTDSMEPTLKVDSMVVVKEVDPSTLVAKQIDSEGNIIVDGDIITFYRPADDKIVTHRLVGISTNEDGSYTLECFGDNMEASSCGTSGCEGKPHDFINSKYLIGKVVKNSYPLGVVYSFISKPLVSFLLIMIPGGYVLIISIIDFIKKARLLHVENEMEKKRKEEGLETHEEEMERLKQEMKNQILEELKKENKEEKVNDKEERTGDE